MNCVVFLLFGLKPLGKGVLLINVFIMAIFLFYSILSHNLGRSSGHHR